MGMIRRWADYRANNGRVIDDDPLETKDAAPPPQSHRQPPAAPQYGPPTRGEHIRQVYEDRRNTFEGDRQMVEDDEENRVYLQQHYETSCVVLERRILSCAEHCIGGPDYHLRAGQRYEVQTCWSRDQGWQACLAIVHVTGEMVRDWWMSEHHEMELGALGSLEACLHAHLPFAEVYAWEREEFFNEWMEERVEPVG